MFSMYLCGYYIISFFLFNHVCPNFIFFISKFVKKRFEQVVLISDLHFGLVDAVCKIFAVLFKLARIDFSVRGQAFPSKSYRKTVSRQRPPEIRKDLSEHKSSLLFPAYTP